MPSRPPLGLLFAVAGTAACGAIASFEPLDFYDPSADASADAAGSDGANDAIATADAPSTSDASDAGVDGDAVPLTCYDRHDGGYDGAAIVFCDDFEREAGVSDGWGGVVQLNGGTVDFTTNAASSGTHSLVVDIPSGASSDTKSAYLRTVVLPAATPMILEADFMVVIGPPAGAGYPTDAFTIGQSTVVNGTLKQAFVRVESANTFDPIFFVPDTSASFAQNSWCHLTWRIVSVTPGGQKLDVFDKATPGTVVERTADEPLDPKDFWIGAETGASLGPVRMYIDDVVIHR